MKCASERWKEVFVVNELSFEPLKDSCTSDRDTPIFIAKDVLKYKLLVYGSKHSLLPKI